MTQTVILIFIGLLIIFGVWWLIPSNSATQRVSETISPIKRALSNRSVQITDDTQHSIPLDEIFSGGPAKDGIPSIDNPAFIGARDASLESDALGIGIAYGEGARFYPFEILVWHEIVNDTLPAQGDSQEIPILVTYCPLCQTGIIFGRRVDGEVQEFGVSGKLWQSNLLMYNRSKNIAEESLWSQVLGEAVVGPATGERLKKYPNSEVLVRPGGLLRAYGSDPYGDYYTSSDTFFPVRGDTQGLHPKTFVYGIEINGVYKAYPQDALPLGATEDNVNGTIVTIQKESEGIVRFYVSGDGIPHPKVGGFWFSWVAAHPDTELWDNR
jgi:hypothetical protein